MSSKVINRLLELPDKSFLLFGPRGTGKSTLLKQKLKGAFEVNLLKASEFVPLSQNPSLLWEKLDHLKAGQWVVIDEVQKIPALLDEVHALYEEKKFHFALSGSSARKLKRGGANLLAGRALQNFLFPLVQKEYGRQWKLSEAVDWGTLPGVVTDPTNRVETLATYVETYLRQELMEEGLVRKLVPFSRFLKMAGLYNAQVLNVENIARESHVGRSTVDKYFEILEDTLIGFRLYPLQLGIQTKETTHPKFYFFDSGVARACAGLIFEEIDNVWRGFSFETQVLHEVRAYNHYQKKHREFFFYKVTGGVEIDLLIETRKKTLSKPRELLAIEIKFSQKWDRRWSQNLKAIRSSCPQIKKSIGVYIGKDILTQDGITIFPFHKFVELLYDGEFF
ncbi:MAG TPA: AAA family ATPase [Bdellovibrio sp.]|nr:AAA family ATPase [Bdellovibrio sp.]